jgi:hypothetical protein
MEPKSFSKIIVCFSAQQQEFPNKPSAYELEELRSADRGEKIVTFFDSDSNIHVVDKIML